jgi:hypothetical protein
MLSTTVGYCTAQYEYHCVVVHVCTFVNMRNVMKVRKYYSCPLHVQYVYTYVQSYAYEYLILQMFAYVASFRERSHLGRAPAAATNDEAAR